MDREIERLGWICIKNKRLLVVRSNDKNIYYIPGGQRADGESDCEALTREIKEKLCVDLKSGTIKFAGTFKAPAHNQPPDVMDKVTGYIADFTGEITANDIIEEVIWVNDEDKKKCSPVTIEIINWLQAQGLVEKHSFT